MDAYPIVDEIRRKHPKQFDTLTRVPVRFVRKQKYSKYVILCDESNANLLHVHVQLKFKFFDLQDKVAVFHYILKRNT